MRPLVIAISKKLVVSTLIYLLLSGLYQSAEPSRVPSRKQQFVSGLAGMTIVIDPGHGGADPGAMFGKTREADLNMQLADFLKARLESAGVKVVMTRTGDSGLVPRDLMTYAERELILQQRKELAARQSGQLLISIHANSNEDPTVSGGMVYYADQHSQALAGTIQQTLNLLAHKNRQPIKRNFTIIKGNSMPSVLIEAAFITNPEDRKMLTTKPDILAQAIFEGTQHYVDKIMPTESNEMPLNGK